MNLTVPYYGLHEDPHGVVHLVQRRKSCNSKGLTDVSFRVTFRGECPHEYAPEYIKSSKLYRGIAQAFLPNAAPAFVNEAEVTLKELQQLSKVTQYPTIQTVLPLWSIQDSYIMKWLGSSNCITLVLGNCGIADTQRLKKLIQLSEILPGNLVIHGGKFIPLGLEEKHFVKQNINGNEKIGDYLQ